MDVLEGDRHTPERSGGQLGLRLSARFLEAADHNGVDGTIEPLDPFDGGVYQLQRLHRARPHQLGLPDGIHPLHVHAHGEDPKVEGMANADDVDLFVEADDESFESMTALAV